MKWLNRFLGTKDKEQEQRTEDVAIYVHEQKQDFKKQMDQLQIQAIKVHAKTKKAHEESIKLLDITTQIAQATGNKENE